MVNGAVSRKLEIAQDDVFSYVFLLSGVGAVALCEKPVCEIGTPAESDSRSNRSWKESKREGEVCNFLQYLPRGSEGQIRLSRQKMAFKQALYYADCIFDSRIAEYDDGTSESLS